MCGRYTLFAAQAEVEERFGATADRPLEPRYNCAPSQSLPVVTNADPGRIRHLRWGLVPTWADDESTSFINARSETVREKRSFAEPFERRRCLVLADGFYEWAERPSTEGDPGSGSAGGKQPYRVALADDEPFAMAGVYERWTPPRTQTGLSDFGGGAAETEPEAVESFAVLTTEPNDVVSPLHDRMSVVLAPDEEETWLHGEPEAAAALCDPYPPTEMRAYPVSTRVNSPANDDPSLVEPVDG
jgi:putative SOS response-associated peptidase YedK